MCPRQVLERRWRQPGCPLSVARLGLNSQLNIFARYQLLNVQVSGADDVSNFDAPSSNPAKRNSRYVSTGVFKDF